MLPFSFKKNLFQQFFRNLYESWINDHKSISFYSNDAIIDQILKDIVAVVALASQNVGF